MAAQPFGQQPDSPRESFIGLAAPVVRYLGPSSPEADRRRKLAVTDKLLTDIEELRLQAGHFLSALLRDRIAAAEAEIIGTRRRGRIKNLRGAYELVLSLQGPLMAANPKNSRDPRLDATAVEDSARRSSSPATRSLGRTGIRASAGGSGGVPGPLAPVRPR